MKRDQQVVRGQTGNRRTVGHVDAVEDSEQGAVHDVDDRVAYPRALFAVIGLTTKRVSVQWASAMGFGVVIVWASVFVWTVGRF